MAVKKTKDQRYSGVDSSPWVVKNAAGTQVISESFTGYKSAEEAATRYTNEAKEWASAVRA